MVLAKKMMHREYHVKLVDRSRTLGDIPNPTLIIHYINELIRINLI